MNAVTAPQSFEDKMKARIRESIGELISDDDLSKLVTKAMDEVFLKPTQRSAFDGYRTREFTDPPMLHALARELLQEQTRQAVDAWLKEHSGEVRQSIEAIIKEGILSAVIEALNSRMRSDFSMLGQSLLDHLGANR